MAKDLTHIGQDGRARMVDVGAKAVTERIAVAQGRLRAKRETISLLKDHHGRSPKGDPIAVSELAGIMGAKRTSDLVPLCHPLSLTSVKVEIKFGADNETAIVTAYVKTDAKTGVEMEALTAVSVACLTLYDMLKAADKSMIIEAIELVEKTGGASGHFKKDDA